MVSGTTAFMWRKLLVARLKERPALAGVQVSYSHPGIDLADESIWCGAARALANIPVMRTGPLKVDETISQKVIVRVQLPQGETQEQADDRAGVLFREVQECLAAEAQFTSDFQWHKITGWDYDGGPLPDSGHGALFEVDVEVKSRLHH